MFTKRNPTITAIESSRATAVPACKALAAYRPNVNEYTAIATM